MCGGHGGGFGGELKLEGAKPLCGGQGLGTRAADSVQVTSSLSGGHGTTASGGHGHLENLAAVWLWMVEA